MGVSIYYCFNRNVTYRNRKPDKCELRTSKINALNLVDESTPSIIFYYVQTGEIEKIPVLKSVTDLVIHYSVIRDHANLLSRAFPQFNVCKLKEKGLQESSCQTI